MNINEFNQKYFNGNMEQCLRHLVHEAYYFDYSLTGSRENLQILLDQLERPDAKLYMQYFKEAAKADRAQARENHKEMFELIGPKISFSYDEVKNATVNPYKSKLASSLLKSLLAGGGLLSYALISQGMGLPGLASTFGKSLVTLIGTYIASGVGINLINYFRFKKAKKEYDKKENIENAKGGRSL